MKRMTSLLCILLALCMVACSSSLGAPTNTQTETKESAKTEETVTAEQTEEDDGIHDPTGFSTGFGKVVVNPEPGTGLAGFGNADVRPSGVILDDICVSCVAISDGENTILLYSLDAIGVSVSNWNQIAKMTEKELGIPKENILLNASHSHSAPGINASYESVASYMKTFYQGALQAAKDAVADLDRSEVKIGSTQTQDMSYIRRYIKKETGEFVGNWPSTLDPALYDHESALDEEMLILYFDRVNQEDIVLCNWQCHVTNVGSATGSEVSSDYVGAFRDEVEERLGIRCAFFQGAAGSTIPYGKLQGEKSNSDYVQHGKDLAQVLIDALPSLTTVESGKIETYTSQLVATVQEEKVSTYGATTNLPLCVFSIGNVAIATAPYEMDHRNGLFVKENSPYAMTFMSAYSNGSYSYIPAETSFPNGGYEVNSCHFVAGTGEAVASELVNMLNTIYED